MNRQYDQVREFHNAFGHPVADLPTLLPPDRLAARIKWKLEEIQELKDATTVEDQADALIDLMYFALGTMVEIGVQPEQLFDIVQRANMAKVWPDGSVHHREDRKIIKPPGWVAPEPLLREEIARQKQEALDRTKSPLFDGPLGLPPGAAVD
jgi:predicted HAD superfamily Cof-like phosphohydrolase